MLSGALKENNDWGGRDKGGIKKKETGWKKEGLYMKESYKDNL